MELTSKLEATKRKIEDMKKNRVVSVSNIDVCMRLTRIRPGIAGFAIEAVEGIKSEVCGIDKEGIAFSGK